MTKLYLKRGCVVIFSLLLFCTSCGDLDLFDSDKWSDSIDWQPNLVAPVAHGKFTLWDLLEDSTGYIQKEPDAQNPGDSVLVIKYVKESIYELNDIAEIFKMPAESIFFTPPDVDVPTELDGMTIDTDLELAVDNISPMPLTKIPEGCDLKEILAKTTLSYMLPRMDFKYIATVVFENIYKLEDGDVFEKTIEVAAFNGLNDAELKGEVELPNVVVRFGTLKEINLSVKIKVPAGETIRSGLISGLAFDLSRLTFLKAVGKLTINPIAVSGKFPLDVDFLNELGGNFKFANPELNVIVKNTGIGVPTVLNMNFWVNNGTNPGERFEGDELNLAGNPLNEEVSQRAGYSGTRLADFLSLPPKGDISYDGTVRIAEQTDETENNVIWSDGSIKMDAEIRIPLKLSATDLQYRDTIDDIDLKDADKLISAKIRIVASNGIPLNLIVKGLNLLDENRSMLGTIKATTGKNILKASAESQVELVLTDENITALSKSNYIILDIGASTTDNNIVTITSNAELNFKLILEAKADLNKLDI